MKQPLFRWAALFYLIITLLFVRTASAQSCSNANIRNDSSLDIDITAVCDAAEPFADEGYEVLLYLTDFNPSDEIAWFDHLDQIEAEFGLRELSTGSIDNDTLAIEASLTSDERWATILTLGDRLNGTQLDTDAGADDVTGALRSGLNSGNATDGFLGALSESADLINLNTGTTSSSDSGNTVATDDGGGISGVVAGAAVVGLLGAGGYYAYPRFVKPAVAKRKRKEELEAHLATIQERVANLLLASENLLDGDKPEDTVLYQVFDAYNGSAYPDRNKRVTEWLRLSQGALKDTFAVRSKLLDEDVQKKRGLEQLVIDWEKLYVTLTGTTERILNLNDAELKSLLDPLEVLERDTASAKLTSQLDAISREIDGLPLKVDLQLVETGELDEEGILGYVDGVQEEIGILQDAQGEAPEILSEAQRERLEAQEAIPRPFPVAENELFAGVDANLAAAQADIEQRFFLRAIDRVDDARDGLDVIHDLNIVVGEWQGFENEIDTVLAEGFRPKQLPSIQQDIQGNLDAIQNNLAAGDYESVDLWIDELQNDARRAHEHVTGWQSMHGNNAERLLAYNEVFETVNGFRSSTADGAWDQLTGYPDGNWSDLLEAYTQAKELLEVVPARLSKLRDWNNMTVQRLDEVDQELVDLFAQLGVSHGNLEAVDHRLKEVRAAEQNIDAALDKALADIEDAEAYRDTEDAKIGTDVDGLLNEARERLGMAKSQSAKRNFIAAIRQQTRSDELATEAMKSASSQVAKINELEHELNELIANSDPKIDTTIREADKIDSVILTGGVLNTIHHLRENLTTARQAHANAMGQEDYALAQGLQEAVDAYLEAEEQRTGVREAIQQSKEEYNELLGDARNAIGYAESAIRSAEKEGNRMGSGMDWLKYVDKARRQLPRKPDHGQSREQLKRTVQQAKEAQDLAKRSEDIAKRQIEQTRRRAVRDTVIITRPSRHYGGGWSSSPRRRSSGGGRSFGGGASRRSTGSFGGGSRRSGSGFGGGSRRSSGGMGRGSRR